MGEMFVKLELRSVCSQNPLQLRDGLQQTLRLQHVHGIRPIYETGTGLAD